MSPVMFIATCQDVANLAESSALYGFPELLPNGDFYASVTLPSLMVATYGGGRPRNTALPGSVRLLRRRQGRRFAEIAAAAVLADELSLGSAVVAEELVQAHEDLGRNLP